MTAAAIIGLASAGTANYNDGWGLYDPSAGGVGGQYTTSVVDAYITACPEPTTIVNQGTTYAVTRPSTITITGTITVTRTISVFPSVSSYGGGNGGGISTGSASASTYPVAVPSIPTYAASSSKPVSSVSTYKAVVCSARPSVPVGGNGGYKDPGTSAVPGNGTYQVGGNGGGSKLPVTNSGARLSAAGAGVLAVLALAIAL